MESLIAYIPVDRRLALLRGDILPGRTEGSALFADISGFTPLTEALVRELGPLRGAEELTRHLNLVYDALINELHSFRGSVIGFSGDAITCWFDADNGLRAVACGLFMQMAMQSLASVSISRENTVTLAMKAAVATGPARRFLVGDPEIQVIEAVAGQTLDHLAAAEHHTQKGEVVLDASTVAALGDRVRYRSRRVDEQSGREFGVLDGLRDPVEMDPWPPIKAEQLDEAIIRQWLLPPVYERLRGGQGELLAEFRPAVSLFARFGGIDYDNDDEAGQKLDVYIRKVQQVLHRYEGSLIQLTMGDKGSYFQAAFGAPTAHEDDVVRTVSAASEIVKITPAEDWDSAVQIGIAQGRMRTGAYGGSMRRTYGVLSDETNLAARFMQAAYPGQILASDRICASSSETFEWEELLPLSLKGKSAPVVVYALKGIREHAAIRLQEPKYALPMVGRVAELDLIRQKVFAALEGKGQIVGLTGEAGMGKSRLVAEVIRLANEHKFIGFGGECQSYGTSTSYLVWQNVWRGFFGLDKILSFEEKIISLKTQLAFFNQKFIARLPLLGPVLNLSIPDNKLTANLDAKLRKSSLEALLLDCLRAKAKESPLLFVFENCHWLDPLSHDLLELVGRAISDLPVFLMMAYRPFDAKTWKETRLSHLRHFTEISLGEFSQAESEELIRLKISQYIDEDRELPAELLKHIVARAEGNPFYLEELINYLQDKGIDPNDKSALRQLDLPSSLHSLILTRIDQRTESQKITIKLASIIGRVFAAAWLWGAYPDLGEPERIRADLNVLCDLDLTTLDAEEPELVYLFRHIVTQEVSYESLPFATRSLLHDQLAQFVERTFKESIDQYVDLLAFHYERSSNEAKKREYLLRAGEVAQANYSNQAALNYYQRVLTLLQDDEQVKVMLKIGQVLELVGRWDDARDLYEIAIVKARELQDRRDQARVQVAMGELLRKQGLYDEVPVWLSSAREGFEAVNDAAGVGQVLHYGGTMAAQQGNYEEARRLYEESLVIRRQLQDQRNISNLLNNLGILARYQRNYDEAREIHQEALSIRRALGDKWAIAISLINLGNVALDQGDYETAYDWISEALALQREVGDRFNIALAAETLGNVARARGDFESARELYNESLAIDWELGSKWH
ncbi:MAG TPA: tetratricopeptide repeat protein, partial [Anaerolineales bacterium]